VRKGESEKEKGKGKEEEKKESGMSKEKKSKMRRKKEKELKSLPLVAPLHPFTGYHSKAVLGVTQCCKDSPPPLGVKRGCAAHGAVQIMSILLNRIALGAGRGPALCVLTSGKHLHHYTALSRPFAQRHHFFTHLFTS